jgi:hypothetical protein
LTIEVVNPEYIVFSLYTEGVDVRAGGGYLPTIRIEFLIDIEVYSSSLRREYQVKVSSSLAIR